MQGWIKLHRKMLHNPIFQDAFLIKLWMYCLLKASHSKHKQLVGSKVIELEEGQFVWGRKEASNDLNKGAKQKERLSESTWERHLKTLEKLEMLSRKTNNRFTVITIEKWRVYQYEDVDFEQQDEQQMNSTCTADEQQVNTNKNVKNLRIKEFSSGSSEQEFADSIKFYQDNLQRGITETPFNLEILTQLFDEWGHELLMAAMKVAAKAEAKGVRMIEGILKNWQEAGVRTVEDARNFQRRYKPSAQRKNNVVLIPKYEKGDLNEKPDGQDSDGFGNVRLFK